MNGREDKGLVLVGRKSFFDLPTACPSCLPVYIYLRLANIPFDMHFDLCNPDSDDIPYVEYGSYVVFNNEKGGIIEILKEDDIVDLDSKLSIHAKPGWLSTKAMVNSWLADATLYELWVGSDSRISSEIYFSDLPWLIGKVLHWKQTQIAKQRLGITKLNFDVRTEEIYRKAAKAYEALSMMLGEQKFFYENRPTSLDAIFLAHALFVLQASDEASILRSKFIQHDNLVRYAENLKRELLQPSPSTSSVPASPLDPSTSSTKRREGPSFWSGKARSKPKKEKTEEEKTFRRRAKYFLAAQVISIVVFLSLLGGSDDADVEVDDDDDGLNYED